MINKLIEVLPSVLAASVFPSLPVFAQRGLLENPVPQGYVETMRSCIAENIPQFLAERTAKQGSRYKLPTIEFTEGVAKGYLMTTCQHLDPNNAVSDAEINAVLTPDYIGDLFRKQEYAFTTLPGAVSQTSPSPTPKGRTAGPSSVPITTPAFTLQTTPTPLRPSLTPVPTFLAWSEPTPSPTPAEITDQYLSDLRRCVVRTLEEQALDFSYLRDNIESLASGMDARVELSRRLNDTLRILIDLAYSKTCRGRSNALEKVITDDLRAELYAKYAPQLDVRYCPPSQRSHIGTQPRLVAPKKPKPVATPEPTLGESEQAQTERLESPSPSPKPASLEPAPTPTQYARFIQEDIENIFNELSWPTKPLPPPSRLRYGFVVEGGQRSVDARAEGRDMGSAGILMGNLRTGIDYALVSARQEGNPSFRLGLYFMGMVGQGNRDGLQGLHGEAYRQRFEAGVLTSAQWEMLSLNAGLGSMYLRDGAKINGLRFESKSPFKTGRAFGRAGFVLHNHDRARLEAGLSGDLEYARPDLDLQVPGKETPTLSYVVSPDMSLALQNAFGDGRKSTVSLNFIRTSLEEPALIFNPKEISYGSLGGSASHQVFNIIRLGLDGHYVLTGTKGYGAGLSLGFGDSISLIGSFDQLRLRDQRERRLVFGVSFGSQESIPPQGLSPYTR